MNKIINGSKQRTVYSMDLGPADAKGEIKAVKLEVYYEIGGRNIWTGGETPRAYSVSVSPTTYIQRDGYRMETFLVGGGLKRTLLPVARKSEKKFLDAVALVDAVASQVLAIAAKAQNTDAPFPDRAVYAEALGLIKLN